MIADLAAAALLSGQPAGGPAPNPLLDALSPMDVREIMEARGGRVRAFMPRADTFITTVEFAGGLEAQVYAYDCEDTDLGELMRCPEFTLTATFTAPDAAAATAAEEALATVWLYAASSDRYFTLGRMEMMQGGVSWARLAGVFATFEQIASAGLAQGEQ